jgi:hypothetical protein
MKTISTTVLGPKQGISIVRTQVAPRPLQPEPTIATFMEMVEVQETLNYIPHDILLDLRLLFPGGIGSGARV